MRIALLSDLHANLEAMEACVADARRREANRFVFLGDYVGYGADAAAVVSRLIEHAEQGALVVKGNHDAAIEHPEGYFNDAAHAALDWARSTLSAGQKRFLRELPLVATEADRCFVHASADRPERWTYIDGSASAQRCLEAAGVPLVFCGHVHDQRLYYQAINGRMTAFHPRSRTPVPLAAHRRWVTIVGSVGQPRDRITAGAYAMFDAAQSLVTFHRVPYDARAAAAKIRRAGLPESLAHRVEAGV